MTDQTPGKIACVPSNEFMGRSLSASLSRIADYRPPRCGFGRCFSSCASVSANQSILRVCRLPTTMRRVLFLLGLQLLHQLRSVTAQQAQSLPSKSVTEYSLPAAAETHEIIAVNDNLLLISQQTDGSLVKVVLDDNGRPTGSSKWQLTTPFSGLHGLVLGSNTTVWATAQFDNVVLQVNPGENDINSAPTIVSTIPIPSPASGPHGILVNNGNLWVTCKDSSHVVRISIADTSDTNVYAVSGRPIFVAVHPTSNDVYASLDLSSKIWHLKSGGAAEEIDVPPSAGTTPVGLLAGPDGNAWVALLGNSTTGTGTFGRINSDASIDWFTLTSNVGQNAGLIHIAFDTSSSRFWLLGSSTVNPSGPNAVFTVTIDPSTQGSATGPRIAIQNTITLPTQWSWTHRIISHGGSLYVTELTTSTLAHISGAVVNGWPVSETWDQYADYGLGLKAAVITYNNTI